MGNKHKILMEHLMEENGEHRKFEHLPDMCSNYLFHLGTLELESFSEQKISAANTLVETHRIRLDHDDIDNAVVLRASKRLMKEYGKKRLSPP